MEDWGPRPLPGLCSGQLQPMRVMLFVMRNLNREQQWGMTGMYFHWRGLQKSGEKKEGREETLRRSCVQKECSLGPKRKTNVIVHCLSLCQTLLLQLVDGLPTSFSTASLSLLPRDSVCSGGQWHSSKWAPVVSPLSACMAVDCVIESECGGACRELEGEASTRVHSGWEGRRKSRDKHWEEQN